MDNRIRKIGIMGGTFDPIHIGHLILGEAAYDQFHLDEVWFVPAGNPPHKQNREGRASDIERVEMVTLAISSNPHFRLCTVEMNDHGYTYSYHTLEKLKALYPDTEWYFIIGADSLFDFREWKYPERICAAAKMIVACRNRVNQEELQEAMKWNEEQFRGTFLLLDSPDLEISSRKIREQIAKGHSAKYYLPDTVLAYIDRNGIYRR